MYLSTRAWNILRCPHDANGHIHPIARLHIAFLYSYATLHYDYIHASFVVLKLLSNLIWKIQLWLFSALYNYNTHRTEVYKLYYRRTQHFHPTYIYIYIHMHTNMNWMESSQSAVLHTWHIYFAFCCTNGVYLIRSKYRQHYSPVQGR